MNKLILSLFFLISNNFTLSNNTAGIEHVVQGQDLTDNVLSCFNKSSESQVVSEDACCEVRVLHEIGKFSGTTAVFKIIERENVLQIESNIITSGFQLITTKKRRSLGFFEDINREERLALRDMFTRCIVKEQLSFSNNNGCMKTSKTFNCTTILPIPN